MAFVFAVPLDRWLAESVARDTLRLVVIFLIVTGVHIGDFVSAVALRGLRRWSIASA